MGAMSRDKGKRGERELSTLLAATGLPYLREQDGRVQGADFRVEQFCIEARYREKLEIPKWCAELELATPDHLVPVLAWRKNNAPWRTSMLMSDWLDLIRAGRA